jgi:hypothetical protein
MMDDLHMQTLSISFWKHKNKNQKLHFLLGLHEGRLEGWELPSPLAMRQLYQSVLFCSGWIVSTYQKQEIAF